MNETNAKAEAKVEAHEDHVFLEKVYTSIENLKTMKKTLGKDIYNVIMLIYLYFLQGIPLGLAASMPLMLSSRNVSYADQGKFSFVFWPFSIKLLWAPIVDSIFIKRVGRRKTWLIPVQFLMGLFMISFANIVQNILKDIKSQQDVILLTVIFFFFTFLSATQDIAVDGWAITMLSKENVSWQSTCNGVGQSAGSFFGFNLFILFESTSFSNKYIRPIFNLPQQNHGIINIKMVMYIFGTIYLLTVLFLIFFKKEKKLDENSNEHNLTLVQAYKHIWHLLKFKPVRTIVFILLTFRIGTGTESANMLKLIDAGVSKEKITLMLIVLTPLGIISPLLLGKYINRTKQLVFVMKLLPVRLTLGLIIVLFVYYTPTFKDSNNQFQLKYYFIYLTIFSLAQIVESTMFVSQMGFFARVSDQTIGGVYMTFLATLANIGGTFPGTLALFLINSFSKKLCLNGDPQMATNATITASMYLNSNLTSIIGDNKCSSTAQIKECVSLGGKCLTQFDAYYLIAIIFVSIGFIWTILNRKRVKRLNEIPSSEWKVFDEFET